MYIEYFEYFLAVCNHKTLSTAAEELNITQPALTNAIHKLEDYLGVELFVRHRRGIYLSEDGTKLYPLAKTLIEDYVKIQHMFHENTHMSVKTQATINILTSALISRVCISQIANDFMKNKENINIKIDEKPINFILNEIKNNTAYDIFVIPTTEKINLQTYINADNYCAKLFSSDTLAAEINKNSEYNTKTSITLNDLYRFPLVIINQENFISQFIDISKCNKLQQIENIWMRDNFILDHNYIGITFKKIRSKSLNAKAPFAIKPISKKMHIDYWLVFRATPNKAIKEFISAIETSKYFQ